MPCPLRSKLPKIYGPIIGGVWERQQAWMVSIPLPKYLEPFWRYNQMKVSTIYCNKDLVAPLTKVFKIIETKKLGPHIHAFNGCFALRKSRRDQRQSVHSWGMAIDINAAENPLGSTPVIDRTLVCAFEEAGFVWGGEWTVPDGMHFQYVTEDK